MAHSHSHSGGHDHSHGGADLSSLVDSDALARIAGSGLLGSGAPRWLLSADAFHARHVARIDGAFKAAAALAAAHWAATVVGGLGRREESGVTRTRPLLRLLRVCFPSPWCAESLLAAAYAAVLVARTAAGVAVVTGEARVVEWVLARASGGSSSDHGSHSHGHSHGYSHGHSHSHGTDHGHGKRSAFVALVALVFRHMIVAAVPNVLATGLLVYIEKTLAAGFRRRLTDHLTRMYLLGRKGGAPNYHAIRKVLVDPGERITRDADRFAKGLADVGGCLVGPIVDFVGFAAAAWSWMRGSGSRQTEPVRNPLYAPSLLLIILSARHLLASNPWTLLTSRLRHLESRYVEYHAQLASNAESIAFLNSADTPPRERNQLELRQKAWAEFEDHVEKTRAVEDRWEGWVVQDLWSGLGMFVAGWNIFASNGNSHHGHGHAHECEHEHDHDHFHEHSGCSDELELASERAAAFLESRALVAGASDAMARLLHAERELRELDGTGERVGEMLDVLESTKEAEVKGIEHADDAVEFESVDILAPVGIDSDNGTENLSPSDEVLVRGLTFRWERGMNILIRGPNGSGKSSLLRLLAGLWPSKGIRSPGFSEPGSSSRKAQGIHLVPQKPYLVPELDLFSNILYPAAVPDDPQVLNALLADLSPHLRLFSLEYLLPYLDPKSSLWGSPIAELRLSPSTTHKLALVRLLAATPAPAFAILDEAVAILRTREEELGFWRALAKRGTHVACISHGRVWGAQEHAEELQGSRFFTHRLRFLGRGTAGIDGEGEWVFERIAESPTLNAISSGVDEEPSGPLGATAHELETEFAPDELERLAELADAGDGRLAQLVKERKDLVKRLNEMEALRRKRDELASLMAGLH